MKNIGNTTKEKAEHWESFQARQRAIYPYPANAYPLLSSFVSVPDLQEYTSFRLPLSKSLKIPFTARVHGAVKDTPISVFHKSPIIVPKEVSKSYADRNSGSGLQVKTCNSLLTGWIPGFASIGGRLPRKEIQFLTTTTYFRSDLIKLCTVLCSHLSVADY